MLYLIKDCRGAKTLVKVGVTKNLQKRMDMYQTHNPLAKCIEIASVADDCDKIAEGAIHAYYEWLGYTKIKNTEWYCVPKGLKKNKDYLLENFVNCVNSNPELPDIEMEITKI